MEKEAPKPQNKPGNRTAGGIERITKPRPKTAKELAAEVGCSVATVRRYWAQPRDEWLANTKKAKLAKIAEHS